MDLENGIIRLRNSLHQPSTQTDQPGNKSGGGTKKVLDPKNPVLRKWDKIIAGISVISLLLVDPMLLYIFVYDKKKKCVDIDYNLTIFVCVFRSVLDIFYFFDFILQFKRRSNFLRFLAIWAALPLPQVAFLFAHLKGIVSPSVMTAQLVFSFPLYSIKVFKLSLYYIDLTRHSRLLPKNPGHGAAVNLLLCMLASNALGACWYFGTVYDVARCWHKSCTEHHCDNWGLYCGVQRKGDYSFLDSCCPLLEPNEIKQPSDFNFGMFLEALQSGLLEKQNRYQKLFYGFWWGLRNLSSLGQNIRTSNSLNETIFATAILITGLFLFAVVIHSIQNYVKSLLANDKKGEALTRERDKIEQWMPSRMLPENLRQRIRECEQHKEQETKSVGGDALIKNLPKDLRRDVTHHLCGHVLIKVLMFVKMDDWSIDYLYNHLEPVLFTENEYMCLEGDPVNKMLFLTRGNVLITSTNGGRRTCLSVDYRPGDYCGEELIPWALDPYSGLPASTITVQSVKDVEGFSLKADHLRFLAYQFRRLNIEKVQHIFRFHSEPWRTWAAHCIQAAWRHNRWKKLEKSSWENEDRQQYVQGEVGTSTKPTATTSASNFSANVPREFCHILHQKPPEPDFGAETSRQ